MARGLGKAREYDYSNVGTAGRRTGLTLKEGRRDEHGMEEVEGLFSSPEKSPEKLNGFDEEEEEEDDRDSNGSEMSIDDDNAPGPMDFLHADKRSRNLPPASQSPVKSARRNTQRSPSVQSSELEQDLSSPSDGKSLLAANGNSRQDPSPLSTRSVNAGPNNRKSTSQKAKVVPDTELNDFSDEEQDENASFAVQDDLEDGYDYGNESVAHDDIPEPIEQDLDQSDSDAAEEQEEEEEEEEEAPPPVEKPAKPTKKAPAAKPAANNKGKSNSGQRGRPAKAARPAEDQEESEARPAKKPKVTKETRPQEPLDPELDKVVENYSQRSGPLKGRSLYILKRENPESAPTHTRSGRVSVRPLAYWRNERCVFGDGEAAEGQRYPLSTIKEIIRTEELEPENKGKGKNGGKKKKSSKSKKRQHESDDEEDPNQDEWEKEDGVLHGLVPKWDAAAGNATEDEVTQIAYAPIGIKTKEVKGSTFLFAKLLTSSFIGSGILDLPPEGVKKAKNSKKMHMVFYVCHGRVLVDVSGVGFSAGKGCVFQVPRGNMYSFANPYGKEARLFFTQGCVPEEGEEAAEPISQPPTTDSQSEGNGNPKPKTGRGRKGKQKAAN
ncbi:hypothetical protein PENSTE_c024G09392 [Penicillium steckii]|uniref:CENP-C homolog n=1 Tax=Penicillium steckii TaxID=303698 RepID=A0A1V6SRS8_9EURO|nr:hypothetical protein PENSTE_c024G09392 [Penicillium steckii]